VVYNGRALPPFRRSCTFYYQASTIKIRIRDGTVEVLRYKSEGRDFDSDCVTGIFHCNNPSGRTMTLGLTQPRKKRVPEIFP
jgi:hypothetical protein